MRSNDTQFSMTPAERLSQVAEILAAGVWRLQESQVPANDASSLGDEKSSGVSPLSCLEVPAEIVLSVHNG